MDLFGNLQLEPVSTEPDVWVSRLVIYERIAPNPIVIRDIPLTRGLNIIWAEESEEDAPLSEITGHSAGKTTFCRFMRHVLGEKTFGTKSAMEFIRRSLPDGYVAAELHIQGRRLAVRRPFGSGRMSYIKEGASVEELLEQRGKMVGQENYSRELGLESLLGELATLGIVQTGEQIQWAHILAWCTRDQESRFQNIHDWRSPRSQADTPSFRFPKSGPLFVMRSALGLFFPDEIAGEKRRAILLKEQEQLSKAIEGKKDEPRFMVNLYDSRLRQLLKAYYPNETDIDKRPFRSDEMFPQSLERLSERATRAIDESIKSDNDRYQHLQEQSDELGADLQRIRLELEEMEALFSLNTDAGREIISGLDKRLKQREQYEEIKDRKCLLGDILIRDCSYIQQRQDVLQMDEQRDARALQQAKDHRNKELENIRTEKDIILKEIEELKGKRQLVVDERNALWVKISIQRDKLRDLNQTSEELARWLNVYNGVEGTKDLDALRNQLSNVTNELTNVEKDLQELIRQNGENIDCLTNIFTAAVRSVLLSNGYGGQVSLVNRELAFNITCGPAMSGEAIETLAVLLADLACLIYNTTSNKSVLPGFLLHDSPREADLGIRIYRNFIRFAASLQECFGGQDSCPFQYLITTTTAPPAELRKPEHVKLTLDASSEEGLLLKRNTALSRGGYSLL